MNKNAIPLIFLLLVISHIMKAANKDFRTMIEAAIKAPSGHNTQPWKFKIHENGIEISPNYKNGLKVVDANHRELFISLGCATENLIIEASRLGYKSTLEITTEGNIDIQLIKSDILVDSLFLQIDKRQTNRNVYDYKLVEDSILNNCLPPKNDKEKIHAYFWQKSSPEFELLTQYIMEGNIMQMEDQYFKDELKSWMRFNKKEEESAKDGLAYDVFGAPNLPKFIAKPITNLYLTSKKQNNNDKKRLESSSHLVLLTTVDNDIRTWITLGIYMQHFLLNLTRENIACSYFNQPCEVLGLRHKLIESLPVKAEIPQILLRVGYGKHAAYSRRKNIQEVLGD